MSSIRIIKANEGNLKNVSLDLPRHKLIVFSGVSGSGKSTLLIDVLFNECQRQYLEAMSLQGIHKPDVERIVGASPAIVISQNDANRNPRSTVGTATDVYTDLRMIYEKLGLRTCPFCGEIISQAKCHETTEKRGDEFHVYMDCTKCGKRMDKITRTYFSFNTKEGACPTCEGLGKVHSIKREAIIHEECSLEEGAVQCWEKKYGEYQLSILKKAFAYYHLPDSSMKPVKQFTPLQKAILYDGVECDYVQREFPDKKPPKSVTAGKFEGIIPILWRRLADKNGDMKQLSAYFDTIVCPDCQGERLGELSRLVEVQGIRLPQLAVYSLEKLMHWIQDLKGSLTAVQEALIHDYVLDMETKLNRYLKVGLGYLTLDRQVITLSGGELQRLRLAAALDSEISGILYILDEPTAGLHPKDTEGLFQILKKLRDLDNTVLVIEHDPDVMRAADYLVDIGPGSGANGGFIIAQGSMDDIMHAESSKTAEYLKEEEPIKSVFRSPKGSIRMEDACQYNLKHLDVQIPTGCITTVTGASGSGKSTLIFEVLAKKGEQGCKAIRGLDAFESIIGIDQTPVARMKRSNVVTFSDAYSEIRKIFAKTAAAKKAGLSAGSFSFNSSGGRCENCEGMGYVENNMLFFADTRTVCPICHGTRFQAQVLAVTYRGFTIDEVLRTTVHEAISLFDGQHKLIGILQLLEDVGLGYLQLGQSLTTLSGGEGQRLKLARELIGKIAGKANLYLLDEPTRGLHPADIRHFMVLLDRLIDAGNTVIIVEHNQQIIKNSDWIIDLGPDGGDRGGCLMFAGTPAELKVSDSITAKYI